MTAGCHQVDPSSPPRSRALGIGAKADGARMPTCKSPWAAPPSSGGDLDTAMAAYHEALKNDPHRADANQRLAVVHDRMGQFKESAGYYAKALAAAPGDAEIFCDKGYSLYLQRRWAEADVCLRQAIALKPRLARAHNNLGLLLAKDGKVDEALAEFRAAGLRPCRGAPKRGVRHEHREALGRGTASIRAGHRGEPCRRRPRVNDWPSWPRSRISCRHSRPSRVATPRS